jgi:hypothetical protein
MVHMDLHLSAFPHVRLPCLHARNVHSMRELEAIHTLVPSNIPITYLVLPPALSQPCPVVWPKTYRLTCIY